MLTKEEHLEMQKKVLQAMVHEMHGQLGGFATKHLQNKRGALPHAEDGESHEEPQEHTYPEAVHGADHHADHEGNDDEEGMPHTMHPESIEMGDHQSEEDPEGETEAVTEVPRAKDKAKKTKRPPRW